MENNNLPSLESHINGDPTLRFLLREATFDYDKLETQVEIRTQTFMVALRQWLNRIK